MPEYVFEIEKVFYNEETQEAVISPRVKQEVIRCRDCKYYNPEKNEYRYDSEACKHPLFDVSDPYECYVLRVEPDDFCSRGERRTDAD